MVDADAVDPQRATEPGSTLERAVSQQLEYAATLAAEDLSDLLDAEGFDAHFARSTIRWAWAMKSATERSLLAVLQAPQQLTTLSGS